MSAGVVEMINLFSACCVTSGKKRIKRSQSFYDGTYQNEMGSTALALSHVIIKSAPLGDC